MIWVKFCILCVMARIWKTLFPMTSQINYGMEWLLEDKDLRIAIAELNVKAGEIAIDGCDHRTAYSCLGAGFLCCLMIIGIVIMT